MFTKLELDEIIGAIRLAAADGFKLVVFTGGEATLRWRDVEAGIVEAKHLGLKSRLVTNGWWGKSRSLATELISRLANAGLDEINFSTGDEHVKYVSLEALWASVTAALAAGFNPLVMIEVHETSVLTKVALRAERHFAALDQSEWERIELLESPWMPLDPHEVPSYPEGHLVNRHNIHTKAGCDSIFSTHTIRPNKQISVCCGLGINTLEDLRIGSLSEAQSGFEPLAARAESDLLKLLIREIGPERVLQEAGRVDPSIKWEEQYAHKCHACVRALTDPDVRAAVTSRSDHYYGVVAESMAIDRVLQSNGLA